MKKILSRLLKWRPKPTPIVAKARPASAHEIALKFAEVHRQTKAGGADANTNVNANAATKAQKRRPATSEVAEIGVKAGEGLAGARRRSDEASVGPASRPKAKKKGKRERKGANRGSSGEAVRNKGGGGGLTDI